MLPTTSRQGSVLAGSGVRLTLSADAAPHVLLHRVLELGFQMLFHSMRAAAQFCGLSSWSTAAGIDTASGAAAFRMPDLPGLSLSGLPLSEIAAAERERLSRWDAAETSDFAPDASQVARY